MFSLKEKLSKLKREDVVKRVKSVPEKAEKRFPFIFVLSLFVITVLLLLAVSYSVTLNERTLEISEIKNDIKSLEVERKAYELLLNKKNDLVIFEDYAKYNLGMIKGEFVEIAEEKERSENLIEAYDDSYSEGGLFRSFVKTVSDKFTEIWNNLLR